MGSSLLLSPILKYLNCWVNGHTTVYVPTSISSNTMCMCSSARQLILHQSFNSTIALSYEHPHSIWQSMQWLVLLYSCAALHPWTRATAACRRGVHDVISFPRPAGKCVISFLLLSINDLINITLYCCPTSQSSKQITTNENNCIP